MKRIIVTETFRKQLKKLKKYIKEKDIIEDVTKFIQSGTGKGETYLTPFTAYEIEIEMVKLRICVYQVDFRYLLGIIENTDYLPIIIDLKKGRYGKNLSLKADITTIDRIYSTSFSVLSDYLNHTDENPKYAIYPVN